MKRDRFAAVYAMRRAQNEYRQHGVPPGDGWDRGTHFAGFEALNRLHWALYRYRIFKRAGLATEWDRREVYSALAAVRITACPVLP